MLHFGGYCFFVFTLYDGLASTVQAENSKERHAFASDCVATRKSACGMSNRQINHKKLSKLTTNPPSNHTWSIPTPPELPSLHQLGISIGMRGSGKTVAISSLLRHLHQHGFADVVFVISPTLEGNKAHFEDLNVENVYEPDDIELPDKIREEIQNLATEYEEYWQRMKQFKK